MSKKYQWLQEITDLVSFKICDDNGTYLSPFVSEHYGRFFQTPHGIRRCLFLNATEQAVLWEILAWMNNEGGYCRVSQKAIAFYTRLSDRTVRTVIKSLVEKGFIGKKSTNSTDVYRINELKHNPYVLLSEFSHTWKSNLTPRNGIENLENEFEYALPSQLEALRWVVNQFIATPSRYESFINRIKDVGSVQDSFLNRIRCDVYDLLNLLYREYAEKKNVSLS